MVAISADDLGLSAVSELDVTDLTLESVGTLSGQKQVGSVLILLSIPISSHLDVSAVHSDFGFHF